MGINMKKIQMAVILSATLFGVDCNGMTPDTKMVIREYYRNIENIHTGDTQCFLWKNLVVMAAKAAENGTADPELEILGEFVGLAMNRLASNIVEKGLVIKQRDGVYYYSGKRADSALLRDAQVNLNTNFQSYFDQILLRLTTPPQPSDDQFLQPDPAQKQATGFWRQTLSFINDRVITWVNGD
jgi:hypothetical protein